MNSCCQKAKKYLKNIEEFDEKEIALFVDNFNRKIKEYSDNGISTFLLECIEVCLELTKSINYSYGEALTRCLKGHLLFQGGQYCLSLKSYKKSITLLSESDPEYSDLCNRYAYNLYCLGDLSKSLEIITSVLQSGNASRVNFLLSGILKCRGENELAFSVMNSDFTDYIEGMQKVHSLLCLNKVEEAERLFLEVHYYIPKEDDFYSAYLETVKARLQSYKNEDVEVELLGDHINALGSKKSFYHYVDGLLNIAEVYIKSGDFERGRRVLETIKSDKRELKALDCRLYKLLELSCLEAKDYEGAYINSCNYTKVLSERNNFDVDKSLRHLTSFLYSDENLVSL